MNGLESMSLIITIISLGNAFPTSPIEEANQFMCACACTAYAALRYMWVRATAQWSEL